MRRSIWELAREQGVPLSALVEPLRAAAASHFNPALHFEASEGRAQVELFIAFRVKETATAASHLSQSALRPLGFDVLEDDELVFQVFFLAEDAAEAEAQDAQFGDLCRSRSVGCGFELVARGALAGLLQSVEPAADELLRARVFNELAATAEERVQGAVLRRTTTGILVLKQPMIVEPSILERTGRLDVRPGALVEVPLREVDPIALADQLFQLEGRLTGQERDELVAAFRAVQIRVDRKTLFRQRFDEFRARPALVRAFCSLVSPESDGRYVEGLELCDLA